MGCERRKEIRTLGGHDVGVNSVAFSPDGKSLASGGGDNRIKLWDVAAGKETASWDHGVGRGLFRVIYSPDGKTLASAGEQGKVKLWDAVNGKERATLGGHRGQVFDVAFSPDGKALAAPGDGREIKLWDVATGKERKALRVKDEGEPHYVSSLAFSADGKLLASGGSREAQVVGSGEGGGTGHPEGAQQQCQRHGIQPGWQDPGFWE